MFTFKIPSIQSVAQVRGDTNIRHIFLVDFTYNKSEKSPFQISYPKSNLRPPSQSQTPISSSDPNIKLILQSQYQTSISISDLNLRAQSQSNINIRNYSKSHTSITIKKNSMQFLLPGKNRTLLDRRSGNWSSEGESH